MNVDDLVHEPVKPDTNDFVFKYTENEKIERIRSSGKSNLAKFNEINKIIKDNGNVVENLSSASDVVAKFGLGLSQKKTYLKEYNPSLTVKNTTMWFCILLTLHPE